MTLNERLQYHVSGAVQRGEAKAILAFEAIQNPLSGDWFIKRGDGRISREHFTNKTRLSSFIAKGETPSF
jgi:hypothetical protein